MAKFLENPTVLIDVDKTTLEAKRIQRVGKIDSGVIRARDVTLVSAEKTALDTILATITNKHLAGDGGTPATLLPGAIVSSKAGLTYNFIGSRWLREPEQISVGNDTDRFIVPDFKSFFVSLATGSFVGGNVWDTVDDGGNNVVRIRSRDSAGAHFFVSPIDLAAFGNWKLTFKIKNPTTDPNGSGNVFRFGLGRKRLVTPFDQSQSPFSDTEAAPYAGDTLNTYMTWGNLGGTNHQFKVYRYNPDRSRTQIGSISASEYPVAFYKISIEKTDTQLIYTIDVGGVVNTEVFAINLTDMIGFDELFLVIGMLTNNGGLCEVNIENLEVAINGHGTEVALNSDYRILAQLREDTGDMQRLTYEGLDILDANSILRKSPGARLFTFGQDSIDLQTSLTAIWNKIKADESIT